MAPLLYKFTSFISDVSGSSQDGTNSLVSDDDDDFRKTAAIDAASLGRLTRLPEYVLESVAPSEEVRKREKEWAIKRAAQTAIMRSSLRRCVQEAASIGLVKAQKPLVYVCGEVKADKREDDDDASIHEEDLHFCRLPFRSSPRGRTRQAHSVDAHVSSTRKEKNMSWSTPLARLEFMEREIERESQWAHESLSALESLPSPKPPIFKRRRSAVEAGKLRECLAVEAAEVAYERTWRLVNEPHKGFRITRNCSCIYCSVQPSAIQTQEYQRLQNDPFYFSPPLWNPSDEDDKVDKCTHQAMAAQEMLPFSTLPTLDSIYGRPAMPLTHGELKEELSRVVTTVALRAMDRSVRLKRKGEGYRIRKRCACVYCHTACPQQTKAYIKRKEGGQDEQVLNEVARKQKQSKLPSSRQSRSPPAPPETRSCSTGGILEVSPNLSPSQVVANGLCGPDRRQNRRLSLSLQPPLFSPRRSELETVTARLSWSPSIAKTYNQEERDDAETNASCSSDWRGSRSSGNRFKASRVLSNDHDNDNDNDNLFKQPSSLDGDVDEEECLRLELCQAARS